MQKQNRDTMPQAKTDKHLLKVRTIQILGSKFRLSAPFKYKRRLT
jgi:hypothetical protein